LNSTIASSIAHPHPPKGDQVLKILRESGGSAVKVSDEEILKAQKLLAERQGAFVEPASAATLAALIKLKDQEIEREKITLVLTESGLKDTKSAMKTFKEPIRVDSWSEFEEVLNKRF
ncbi:MAG: pyridoxal-phosphate dependent enzyme, partial [Archaeoglobaceae archaeon]